VSYAIEAVALDEWASMLVEEDSGVVVGVSTAFAQVMKGRRQLEVGYLRVGTSIEQLITHFSVC